MVLKESIRFLTCLSCGISQLDPFPNMSQLIKAYPENYPAYIQDITQTKGMLYQFLVWIHFKLLQISLHLMIPKGASVLDIGAGNGDYLLKLKKIGAGRLVGIDFNSMACNVMSSKGIETYNGVFPTYESSEKFNVIVMNNYIEHVLDPTGELSKAFSLLCDEGSLIGTLPNFSGLDRLLFGRYWGGNHVPRHTFQYTPSALSRLLNQVGFKNIKITQDINPSHIAISLQNYFQRSKRDLIHNAALKYGRAWYYNYLLLLTLPVNALFKILGRSGVISFTARKQ